MATLVAPPAAAPARARRPLDSIFEPRSIAVIGASRRRSSIGFSLLHNLISAEFAGALFPVNPDAAAVHSLKCYPSLDAIPDPVDLAVVMVPKGAVQAVVEAAIAKGVRGLVVITAGFAETGEEGARRERRLRDAVRAAGVRMIGPNCMGVINTAAEVRLNATFAPTPAEPGPVGFVSQSGALGVAILNVARDLGVGFTQFVSMGNKADVSGNDLLEHWEDDPATQVIAMYLESFGNPRRFTEIAKRVSRKKPILVVKSGRTREGARAASSHTGAIAGADLTVSAILEHCGVLRADTIEDLFDVTRALVRCPLPAGRRTAIVTNAGGPAIMATDACVNLGLAMAELAPATRDALAFLPAEASIGNPVDMIASATAETYARTLAAVLDDPAVDMAMAINVTPLLANPIDVMEAIGDVARERAKPVLAVMMATEEFYESTRARRDLPPVYRFPESAARAMTMLARYAAWRGRPEGDPAPEFPVDDAAVAALLDRAGPDGYLAPADAFRLLEIYGLPLAAWRVASSPDEALRAAGEIGYPVVVKAIAPGLVHKSDVGAVALDLRDERELAAALDRIEAAVAAASNPERALAAAGRPAASFLVQEMAKGGHEVIFGVSTDPRFGPLLMFGLGGRYVEVFQDVRFGVLPLAPREAAEMVAGIRGVKLLEGVRGEPGADMGLLAEMLLRLAQLVARHPRIDELDVNPFLAAHDRAAAKAVDARIRVDIGTPAPAP